MRRHKGPSPKSLDLDEKLKPLYTLFCRDVKICRNLRTFLEDFGQEKDSFGSSTVFSGLEVHGIYCILY